MADAQGAGPLRLLLIDDCRDDAELAEIALRDGGLAVTCHRAWSAETVRDALAAHAPQLVLSDLNLPGFSGVEAFELVRAHDARLPFVFLTGAHPTGSFLADPPGTPLPGAPEAPPSADGFLSKSALDELAPLVRKLLPSP